MQAPALESAEGRLAEMDGMKRSAQLDGAMDWSYEHQVGPLSEAFPECFPEDLLCVFLKILQAFSGARLQSRALAVNHRCWSLIEGD